MKLTEIEKTELYFAIITTEDYYKERIRNLLEIRKDEEVERSIMYWESQLKNLRSLKEKIIQNEKMGEL